MTEQTQYAINSEIQFEPLQRIDIQQLVDATSHPWSNYTLCRVNDSVVRLGILKGEFHWHKHDEEDEFFYVVDGRLVIELPERRVELGPRQGFTVPKGVRHRTTAAERTVVLMVENASVKPTGD